MNFGFFSSNLSTEFARTLARNIARRYPPVIANNPEQTVSRKRIAEILAQVMLGVPEFNHGNRPGILDRARLGMAFKAELRELGYEDGFINRAARELTTHLALGPK